MFKRMMIVVAILAVVFSAVYDPQSGYAQKPGFINGYAVGDSIVIDVTNGDVVLYRVSAGVLGVRDTLEVDNITVVSFSAVFVDADSAQIDTLRVEELYRDGDLIGTYINSLISLALTDSGFVHGPSGATDGYFPLFDGATGRLLKDGPANNSTNWNDAHTRVAADSTNWTSGWLIASADSSKINDLRIWAEADSVVTNFLALWAASDSSNYNDAWLRVAADSTHWTDGWLTSSADSSKINSLRLWAESDSVKINNLRLWAEIDSVSINNLKNWAAADSAHYNDAWIRVAADSTNWNTAFTLATAALPKLDLVDSLGTNYDITTTRARSDSTGVSKDDGSWGYVWTWNETTGVVDGEAP